MSVLKNDGLDDDLAVPAQLVEPADPAERRRLLAEAEASIAAGRGVPHAQARVWLSELAAGRPAKAQCAR